MGFRFFITLNFAHKQKQDKQNGLFNDAVLLLKTFESSTTILAQALIKA